MASLAVPSDGSWQRFKRVVTDAVKMAEKKMISATSKILKSKNHTY